MGNILELQNLVKYFPVKKGLIFQRSVGQIKAVDDVSFALEEGDTLGLVGESGCGKTTIAKLILQLEKATSGGIKVANREIIKGSQHKANEAQISTQAVFQDPYSSLNPRMKVGDIIAEPIVAASNLPKTAIKERVAEVLDIVGLWSSSVSLYPHELSGGQRQRVALARALAPNPKFMVLDEPVSALDVSIRAQILNLIVNIQQNLNTSYLFIAHDLAVVMHISTVIVVMYLGKIMEQALSQDLYNNPLHPYTKGLIAAVPQADPDRRFEQILPGEVPSPLNPPPGCRFHPRCRFARPVCSEVEPPLREVARGHKVACHFI